MDKVCWIGNPYFGGHMRKLGWDVTIIKRQRLGLVTWAEVVDQCGGTPDAVAMGDASLPPCLAGVEAWPCLTAFHCVDAHIHSWHPVYAQAFDLCSVSLKDTIPSFREGRLTGDAIRWLPPWAQNNMVPRDMDKKWDLLFVGTVNPETTPVRHSFLEALKERFDGLHVTSGDFRELFPQARIVLNFCERGDLNFRVFEALGIGACLLTPDVGHGQEELFTPGEDLFTYPMDDMDALLERVGFLLDHDELREEAGARGTAKVDAAHRATHRAEEYSDWLRAHLGTQNRRVAQARDIHKGMLKLLYLHLADDIRDPALRAEYLRLAQGTPTLD